MLPAPRVRMEERVAAESVILTEEELAWSGDRCEMHPPKEPTINVDVS